MNVSLKSCPFCKSKAQIFCNNYGFYIECSSGCCRQIVPKITKELAADAWNRRAKDDS